MSWFGKKKIPYRDLAVEAINKALAINIKHEKVFESYSINNLEAVIALFWMVEQSLHGLSRPKLELAGSHMMDELLHWLSEDYSFEEMSRFVIPALDKRLNEYSELFVVHAREQPRVPLMRTFKRIVENVLDEDDAHIARVMAAILLWWQPISVEGARITDLDRKGEVAW